ncbi:hypothetical protein TIFTF001_016730 [Ficus carica]|uniref:Uncharacterized protein n=1 Tax=Ficus carica TaxID=3494 RepID=A0AA88ATM0_FICCA|nr:hypothetical protein TIFTF001_016730 [Ficus carica]
MAGCWAGAHWSRGSLGGGRAREHWVRAGDLVRTSEQKMLAGFPDRLDRRTGQAGPEKQRAKLLAGPDRPDLSRSGRSEKSESDRPWSGHSNEQFCSLVFRTGLTKDRSGWTSEQFCSLVFRTDSTKDRLGRTDPGQAGPASNFTRWFSRPSLTRDRSGWTGPVMDRHDELDQVDISPDNQGDCPRLDLRKIGNLHPNVSDNSFQFVIPGRQHRRFLL